jgi:uncharacterized membrane protein
VLVLVLRGGVYLSVFLTLVGLVLHLASNESALAVSPLPDLAAGLVAFSPSALVTLGILLLLLTPIAGAVVVAVFAVRLRDRVYALSAFLVLLVLGVSLGLAFSR